MTRLLLAMLSLLGVGAFLSTYFVLARLSRRLGDVLKMKPYYRGYYLSAALAALALTSDFISLRVHVPVGTEYLFPTDAQFLLWTFYLPLALSAIVALIVTWRYWGWLLRRP
ncbi:MAG: hypothetical protein HY327_13645 [Chloroflexi bacterium]|nr:hypothetical protein [Chloroflexota bacterium]